MEVTVLASLITLWLREQLRLLKPIITRTGIDACRVAQDKLGELGARAAASKTTIENVPFPNFEAAAVVPTDCVDNEHVILYLHGGGYTAGSLSYALGFGSVLAVRCGIPVFCVAYRLAPEHPFPAALEDAVNAYRCLLSAGLSPENISIVGESAGGGLLFGLCLWLKVHHIPLPSKLVALSPWTDLTLSGHSYDENARRDPCLSEDSLRFYAQVYAKDNAQNPLVSPIFGDLHGLPPSLIFVGEDEILLDDSVILHKRLRDAGCKSTLHIEPGLWHVYVLYGVPEANAALERIRAFLLPGTAPSEGR